MNTVLLTAGAAALLGAVIGGGFSAFGIDIPKLVGLPVRIGLGVLGVAFIAAAVVLRDDNGVDQAEARYQRRVVATCNAVRTLVDREDFVLSTAQTGAPQFDRDATVATGKANLQAMKRRLDLLMDKPVPDSLKDEAEVVRKRANRFVRQNRAVIDELRSKLPATFTLEDAQAAAVPLQAKADAVLADLEGALADLAGRECALSSS